MIEYCEAVRLMHNGHIIQYIGTINGNVFTLDGGVFCMKRGTICLIEDDKFITGKMIYDPDFRYKVLDEMNDTKDWSNVITI